MAEGEYDEKRPPNLGSRSAVRHGVEGAASAGSLALLLQALVDYGTLNIQEAFVALAILTPIATTALKVWSSLGFTARLRAWLDKRFPAAPAIALLLIPLLGGCAIQLGTMQPKQFSTLGGGTLIACETKGILLAIGDADLCSNSARGGHVSKTFSQMTLGVVRTVGAAIAGFFGGAGRGMADALEADAVEAPVPPVAEPSAPPALMPAPGVVKGLVGSQSPSTNPFTAPDPD